MKPLLMLGFMAFAATAQAQTHPCDQAVPTSQTVQSSGTYKAQFCAKPDDQLEAFVVYTNGVATDLRPLTLVTGPNAAGMALYEGPQELRFPRGSYVVEVAVVNRPYAGGPVQYSAKSNPLALAAVDDTPPAAAPKFLGVIR